MNTKSVSYIPWFQENVNKIMLKERFKYVISTRRNNNCNLIWILETQKMHKHAIRSSFISELIGSNSSHKGINVKNGKKWMQIFLKGRKLASLYEFCASACSPISMPFSCEMPSGLANYQTSIAFPEFFRSWKRVKLVRKDHHLMRAYNVQNVGDRCKQARRQVLSY